MNHKIPLISRDISWLSFNDRVLQEARDPTVPLLERLKFLGIVSSNRDEFFRVRVAIIRRMQRLGRKGREVIGEDPGKLLERIQAIVLRQQDDFDHASQELLREMERHGIIMRNERQIPEETGEWVRRYFRDVVQPALAPILLDQVDTFPYLKDRCIYFVVVMHRSGSKTRRAIMEIPTAVSPRFIALPGHGGSFVMLDDVIRYCLDDLFFMFEYDRIEALTIKLTRDAELDIDSDVNKSLVHKVSEGLNRRKKGLPTRLVYDSGMDEETHAFLLKRIRFGKDDQPVPGARYHNFVDFMRFPMTEKGGLNYRNPEALNHPYFRPRTSLFDVIREKDVLLSFPYQNYGHIIDLLREASMDPFVRSIQITLYRLADNSHIVKSLVNAIRNGKDVTAVIELRARFDEEANIRWAGILQDEGARVIHGVPGLKMHAKLFLITRMEQGKEVGYAHVGTGNFNEDTARVYADHSLLTRDKRISDEVGRVFRFYRDNFRIGSYKHLVVAPFFARRRYTKLIDYEIAEARAGRDAWILLKLNSITDTDMIRKLYEASQSGVRVRIIVRGACSLVPGQAGFSDNIEVISIVDRYLEHARVYVFSGGGVPRYYLSSGDWMTRNLDARSEIAVPIYDAEIQSQLRDILEIQWSDSVKARIIDERQENRYRSATAAARVRSQDAIRANLATLRARPRSSH